MAAEPAGPPEAGPARLYETLRRPGVVLGAMMSVYIGIALILGSLRLLEFTATNWDLGIFQQALSSTLHGHLFYESGDWESTGVASFLQVHPALILFLVLPLYAALPYAATLLALQAALVGLAAYPLYRLGCLVLPDRRHALAIAGLYLAFAPVLTSNNYDFHLEAFLPLELFYVFLFWFEARRRAAAVAATLAFVTLEVAPFFVAAMALYFFLYPDPRAPAQPVGPLLRAAVRRPGRALRQLFGRPEHRARRLALGLLLGSAVAYVLLRVFEWWIVPLLVGAPPNAPVGGPGVAGIAAATGVGLDLQFAHSLGTKLGYWLLLLALLGFLPLFAPRLLILAVPWFFFTIQSSETAWSVLGYQYGFLATVPLLLAAVFGLATFRSRVWPQLPALLAHGLRRARGPTPDARAGPIRPRRGPGPVAAIALLLVLLAANISLTPANPLLQDLTSPHSAYEVSYHVAPGYEKVVSVAALIPPHATVLASDDLFPLVANDPNAYALWWTAQQPQFLPFNASHLPPYVLLSAAQPFAVPGWLWPVLANQSVYGLLGATSAGPGGTVYLYQAGYTGPLQYFGADLAVPGGPPVPAAR